MALRPTALVLVSAADIFGGVGVEAVSKSIPRMCHNPGRQVWFTCYEQIPLTMSVVLVALLLFAGGVFIRF